MPGPAAYLKAPPKKCPYCGITFKATKDLTPRQNVQFHIEKNRNCRKDRDQAIKEHRRKKVLFSF